MTHSSKASSESMRHNQATKAGQISARSPTRKYPLRKIMDSAPNPHYPGVTKDVLDCGHQVLRAEKLFGEVNRYRRRCKECYENQVSPSPAAKAKIVGERIQRRRTKGYRLPDNTVYVGRPSLWGNDFVVDKDGTAAQCVGLYRQYFLKPTLEVYGMDYFEELRGKNLACWCPIGQPCHADLLLALFKAAREG